VRVRRNGTKKNAYSFFIWHSELDSADAAGAVGMGPVYLKVRPQEVLPAKSDYWTSGPVP
jgi:hypothetical protein